jgi:hypothetical protein
MLAAMSFNGGVFIAVILGFVVGYFFFRSHGEEDNTESPSRADYPSYGEHISA